MMEISNSAEESLEPTLKAPIADLPPKWSGMLSHEEDPYMLGHPKRPRLGQYIERVQPTALLGLATTEELLQELAARGRTEQAHPKAGEMMMRGAEAILNDLPPEMKRYRTVE